MANIARIEATRINSAILTAEANKNNVLWTRGHISSMVEDNIVSGGDAWDYGFIILISGTSSEVVRRADLSSRKAGEVANLLTEEIFSRIYRLKFTRRQDDLSQYIKDFLSDHQRGKLKRYILSRIKAIPEGMPSSLEDYYNWLVNERVMELELGGLA